MRLTIEGEGGIDLPIEFMQVKDCLFYPTLKPEHAKRLLRAAGRQLEMTLELHTSISEGYYGVKLWRVA